MISCTCWQLIVIHSLTTIAQRSRLKSDQWNPSLPWSSTTVEHPVSFFHSVSYDGPSIILITTHANNERRLPQTMREDCRHSQKRLPLDPILCLLQVTTAYLRHELDGSPTNLKDVIKLSESQMSNRRSLHLQNIRRAVPVAALAAITRFSRLPP